MPPRKPVSPKPAESPIAMVKREAQKEKVDLSPLILRLEELLDQRNLSRRFAAIQAGLDHQGLHRIMAHRRRPDMTSCILLADFFDVNPNEFLVLAGWPKMKMFSAPGLPDLPPESVEVARDLAKISNDAVRREVADAIRVLLRKYFSE